MSFIGKVAISLNHSPLLSAQSSETICQVLQMMRKAKLVAVPVVHCGHVIGIFARGFFFFGEKDYDSGHRERVGSLARKDFLIVSSTSTTESCLNLMRQRGDAYALILDGDLRTAILSYGEVMNALIEDKNFEILQLTQYIRGWPDMDSVPSSSPKPISGSPRRRWGPVSRG